MSDRFLDNCKKIGIMGGTFDDSFVGYNYLVLGRKFFVTGQAAVAVAAILLAVAITALLSKSGHRRLMIASAVASIMLFLLFSSLIGVCASPDMRCHTTDLWCRGAAVVSIAASVIELSSGKEGQIPS